MYQFLSDHLHLDYEIIRTIKKNDVKSIDLIMHKKSRQKYILRSFKGSSDIYQKLVPVRCPYLPEILEAASSDGRSLVLEEYVTGDSLFDMIKGSLFTIKETRQIALDVCRALYVLHNTGIVHRDVKPENIILRRNNAVLIDFDAARTIKEDSSSDTVILGTAGYAAPEQYGVSQTDGRADIYALGITMNLMLTGEHPSVRLADGHMGKIVSRCTMVSPEKRFTDITVLMDLLS